MLKEELLDLSAQPAEEISLLRYTPAAGSIGTCRYKLKPHQTGGFRALIEVFRAHDMGYFIYIGGNDSMDTANKIAQLAQQAGLDLIGIGGPKTIDNDVGDSEFKLIDHTPGYGSTAKYWMHAVQNANEENMGSCPADPVLVMQAMGRKIGFIPAAARLADPDREMPLQIYLAESPCSLQQLADNVNDQLKRDGRCLVVVSEGFDVGEMGEVKDVVWPHLVQFQPDDGVSDRGELSEPGGLGGQGRGPRQRPGHRSAAFDGLCLDGRPGRSLSGRSDRRPCWRPAGESGYMATILRNPATFTRCVTTKCRWHEVANSERTFPADWIAESG